MQLLHASSVTPEMAKQIGIESEKFDLKTSLDLGAELTKLGSKELSKTLNRFDIGFMNQETFETIFKTIPNEKIF